MLALRPTLTTVQRHTGNKTRSINKAARNGQGSCPACLDYRELIRPRQRSRSPAELGGRRKLGDKDLNLD